MKIIWVFAIGHVVGIIFVDFVDKSVKDENLVGFCLGSILLEMLKDFVYRLTMDVFLVDCHWRLVIDEILFD